MLFVLALTVLLFDSVIAMAYSYALSAWIDVFIAAIPNKKLANYGIADQMKDSWKIFLAALIMGAVVFAMNYAPMALLLKLCVQILSGVIVYIIMCWLLKIESFRYVLNMLKGLKNGEEAI